MDQLEEFAELSKLQKPIYPDQSIIGIIETPELKQKIENLIHNFSETKNKIKKVYKTPYGWKIILKIRYSKVDFREIEIKYNNTNIPFYSILIF